MKSHTVKWFYGESKKKWDADNEIISRGCWKIYTLAFSDFLRGVWIDLSDSI